MTADEQRFLDESGYLVIQARGEIPRTVLVRLEALFEGAGENAGHALRSDACERNANIAPVDFDLFAELASAAQIGARVGYVLGGEYALAALKARSSNPFALALDPLRPGPGPAVCRVLWLLDDFTEEGVGALRVAPGSHLSGQSPAEAAAITVSGAAGSAVVLDGRLWSAAGATPGRRHLRTLRCEYLRRGARDSG